ncbi:hypothetical protein D9758_001415 [Tetrapyrgos nigripes]|uniref:Uncharacterized protein n=1 Tax=Tetrapyrgos nigripes TaxID=182062 RepID=A0A8H5GSF2_9AGAR|nr:hypothetical protein D9758_001415 [Tetrapyrgos nigripes]
MTRYPTDPVLLRQNLPHSPTLLPDVQEIGSSKLPMTCNNALRPDNNHQQQQSSTLTDPKSSSTSCSIHSPSAM